ncbi:unnamed protein product [Nesidiocoris tenuis]|uniref:Uncharacterized protein n=1 Tax=Nesidiocoris tenuis TaxID=355587 RepID=A0A6H5H476_9HEMI|nr:unnamed protein product [Nesidiocoris tenuis]
MKPITLTFRTRSMIILHRQGAHDQVCHRAAAIKVSLAVSTANRTVTNTVSSTVAHTLLTGLCILLMVDPNLIVESSTKQVAVEAVLAVLHSRRASGQEAPVRVVVSVVQWPQWVGPRTITDTGWDLQCLEGREVVQLDLVGLLLVQLVRQVPTNKAPVATRLHLKGPLKALPRQAVPVPVVHLLANSSHLRASLMERLLHLLRLDHLNKGLSSQRRGQLRRLLAPKVTTITGRTVTPEVQLVDTRLVAPTKTCRLLQPNRGDILIL